MKAQKGIICSMAMCPNFDGVFAVASYSGTCIITFIIFKLKLHFLPSVGLYSTQTNACDTLIGSNDGSASITHLQYSSCGNLLFAGHRKVLKNFVYSTEFCLSVKIRYFHKICSKTQTLNKLGILFSRVHSFNATMFVCQLDYFTICNANQLQISAFIFNWIRMIITCIGISFFSAEVVAETCLFMIWKRVFFFSGSSCGDLLIYDLKTGSKGLNNQITQTEFVEPTHKIKCSEAVVTGLR